MVLLLGSACAGTGVMGTVVDEAGPVPDVTVEVMTTALWLGIPSTWSYYEQSLSSDGGFRFEVPAGSYTVVASAGTCTGTTDVDVVDGEWSHVDVPFVCVW